MNNNQCIDTLQHTWSGTSRMPPFLGVSQVGRMALSLVSREHSAPSPVSLRNVDGPSESTSFLLMMSLLDIKWPRNTRSYKFQQKRQEWTVCFYTWSETKRQDAMLRSMTDSSIQHKQCGLKIPVIRDFCRIATQNVVFRCFAEKRYSVLKILRTEFHRSKTDRFRLLKEVCIHLSWIKEHRC